MYAKSHPFSFTVCPSEIRDSLTWCGVDKPGDDPQVRGDAFKTLFVARLSYDTNEKDLEREFGRFGPIERVYLLASYGFARCKLMLVELQIRIVTDTHEMDDEGKPSKKKKKSHRGYAFVVYEREKDMKGTASSIPLTLTFLCQRRYPLPILLCTK